MDISEFLASMQTNPSDRALARNTQMGIPDADNNPNTRDAAPADQQQQADDNQAPPAPVVDQSQPEDPNAQDGSQSFAEGGEVGDDDLTTGAIPEPPQPEETPGEEPPKKKGFREMLGDAMGLRGRAAQVQTQTEGAEGWRNAAEQGINAALQYGRDVVHGVNRPVSDDTHESDVKDYLSGKGAMDSQQMAAAQQSVDPEGALDPSTRLQKTLGSLYEFYNKGNPDNASPSETASKAVWSALQYTRRAHDLAASHAAVAQDRGNAPVAAQAATVALNHVPDGLLAQVQPLQTGGYSVAITDPENKRPVVDVSLDGKQMHHLLATGWDNMVEHGTPAAVQAAAQAGDTQHRRGQAQALAQWQRANPGSDNPNPQSGAGRLTAQGKQATATGNYPTSEQAWRFQQRGGVNLTGPTGLGPADPGARPRNNPEENGLPASMNMRGMGIAEQQRLRAMNNEKQVRGEDKGVQIARENSRGRIEAAGITAGQRERTGADIANARVEVAGVNAGQRERTGADTNQQKRDVAMLPARSPTTDIQKAKADIAVLNRAAAAADADLKSDPTTMTQEQRLAKRKTLIDEYTNLFRQHLQTGQPPAAPALGDARGASAPVGGAPQSQQPQTREYQGRTYVFDPAKKGWVAQ